jgi:hypothetical protein
VQNNNPDTHFSRLREIPPAVWALGFVSLLMDLSSEIIHALLPVYLVTVLGARPDRHRDRAFIAD